ncbi:hypothetical protein H4R99_001334 [Coemansia sp. RSA 1722]|nr:hypothetical protein IWW45_001236 [Coemansia sp. RSA 485]KAJ2599798.1 hypothetical protein GGF39_002076 [Coemansia sp. RSA 1721]KAJ2605165.1 hypothetical protein H4R99_001334 [Coemansia sp. RSA 1722]KAJ2638649.1 hypothetical protein GGF40_001493 [Coemansia sp. RSA 1286]
MKTYTESHDFNNLSTEQTTDSGSASESNSNSNSNDDDDKIIDGVLLRMIMGSSASTIGIAAGVTALMVLLAGGIFLWMMLSREKDLKKEVRAEIEGSEEEKMERICDIAGTHKPPSLV